MKNLAYALRGKLVQKCTYCEDQARRGGRWRDQQQQQQVTVEILQGRTQVTAVSGNTEEILNRNTVEILQGRT